MITTVNALLSLLDEEASNIVDMLSSNRLSHTDVFDEPVITFPTEERPWNLRGRRGVYVFIVTSDLPLSKENKRNWNNIRCAGFLSLADAPDSVPSGKCWYLGKADSQSLYSRLGAHYSSEKDAQGLKMNHPNRVFMRDYLQCILFPIKEEYSEEARKIIIPAIEKRLHNKLKPVVGSSR